MGQLQSEMRPRIIVDGLFLLAFPGGRRLSDYTPKPVDTSSVKLDPSLLELVEYLARNTHEVWSAGRIREGWTWGPRRDAATKRHPALVPYEQLTEGEKEFDRHTAIKTLKLIATLGYVIQPPARAVRPDAAGAGP